MHVPMSLIENTRAGFDYVILETLEAGLELLGFEVKSSGIDVNALCYPFPDARAIHQGQDGRFY